MTKYILTCEHGGNYIPQDFREYFKTKQAMLNSHRGYDIGILNVFKLFSKKTGLPHFYSNTSRLLIDANRSLNNKNLFSDISQDFSEKEKNLLTKRYYMPFRTTVELLIGAWIEQQHQVYHISFHSFTPVLKSEVRKADIGFLYDPKNAKEKVFSSLWRSTLESEHSKLCVRFNYPYFGTADGFTTYLRKTFGTNYYSGIELEVNQKLISGSVGQKAMTEMLLNSFNSLRFIDSKTSAAS